MNLDKVKSDIDALLKKHEENWMNHVFGDKPEVCKAFKDKQVAQAMLIMATMNVESHNIKEPEITTHQEGWDLRFTWRFSNQYYLSLTIVVPWEGQFHYEINTFDEDSPDGPMCYGDWKYKDFNRVDGPEVSDFSEHLKEATEQERNLYGQRTAKGTN